MKIRQHRGHLQASLETMKEIPATKEAVCEYINNNSGLPLDFGPGSLKFKFVGIDPRIKQNVFYVMIDGVGVVAIVDEEPTK